MLRRVDDEHRPLRGTRPGDARGEPWIRNVNGSSCGTGGSNAPAQNVYVEELAVS